MQNLPVLEAFVPPTRLPRSRNTTVTCDEVPPTHDIPPHLPGPPPHSSGDSASVVMRPTSPASSHPSPSPAVRQSRRLPSMSKLNIPALKGSLEPANINAWLNGCADSFEAHGLMNPECKISPSLQILFAGLKMEEDDAKLWWNENRDALKALLSWSNFSTRVREHFVPANWRLDALARFFAVRQDKSTFWVFLSELQAARNVLSSAGKGYVMTDAIFKNHLLFHSHPVLQLHVRALPSLVYVDIKLDALINLMQSTWDSLVAENITMRTPMLTRTVSAPSFTSMVPGSTPSQPYLPLLTDAECEKLRAARGCFNCRRTPSSPDWKQHNARDCPGDATHGIPPRSAPGVVAAIFALAADRYDASDDDDDDLIALNLVGLVGPDYEPQFFPRALVAAIMPTSVPPSCVLEGPDTDSDEEY